MKKFLLSALCVVSALVASAAGSETFTVNSSAKLTNWAQTTSDNATITINGAKGDGTSEPTIYQSKQYRVASGNTISFSVSDGFLISGISSTASNEDYKLTSDKATADNGTVVDNGGF